MKIRNQVRAEKPAALVTVLDVAYRAVTAEDPGVLAGLLDELAGADLDGTPLEPLVGLVDGLLDTLLSTGDQPGVVTGLLDLLTDLLDGLLGGLLGGRTA
ncbi:hypothetical protein [Nocardioides sp. TF02-7]|uniref:hypothetical protein n=1 Tax=Nocardioides sp. TF02-7 TaxID=2917724 RepID=UPI001F05557A|nr:hypothetical protein [Nocardioides sp. TF02-7]UMG91065.1 hypothetical protein MF408_12690 [Nocardioides sp. TF02-7]